MIGPYLVQTFVPAPEMSSFDVDWAAWAIWPMLARFAAHSHALWLVAKFHGAAQAGAKRPTPFEACAARLKPCPCYKAKLRRG
jgi:hypothetical protein